MTLEFIPIVARTSGFVVLMPWWQSPSQKLLLFSLAGLIALAISDSFSVAPTVSDLAAIFVRIPTEFVFGILLALPAVVYVSAAELLGELYDFARGQSLVAAFDPTLNQSSSSTAQLFRHVCALSLLTAPGIAALISSLTESLTHLPDASTLISHTELLGEWSLRFICLWLQAITRIALPVSLLFVSIDISLGLLAKILPNLNVANEGFFLKSAFGLLILIQAVQFDFSHGAIELLDLAAAWEVCGG